jgi:hypothetical protein
MTLVRRRSMIDAGSQSRKRKKNQEQILGCNKFKKTNVIKDSSGADDTQVSIGQLASS